MENTSTEIERNLWKAHLVIVILDDLKVLPDLLKAWRAAGIPGATILQSAGAYRTTTWLSRVGLGALDRLFDTEEVRRRTLLTLIEDETTLDRAIVEAERVVGGFDRPNSGLLMVLPVTHVRGLHKSRPAVGPAALPPALRPDWLIQRDTSIEDVAAIMNLEPVIVRTETTLDEVAQAMQAHPNVHLACVVNDDDQLVGVLQLQALADDLFFHIMPEEFLVKSFDLERVMDYAQKSRMSSAADAMQPAVWVKRGETVKDAFKRMHEHKLPGLPLVDDRYRVVGYINLLELLAACARQISADSESEASR